MKTDQQTEDTIRSHAPAATLSDEHVAQLLQSVDELVISTPELAETSAEVESTVIPLTKPVAPRSLRRTLLSAIGIAASVSVLAVGGFAASEYLTPAPAWAEGKPLDSARAEVFKEVCAANTFRFDDAGNELPPHPAELRFAEYRGDQSAIWYEFEDGNYGACLVYSDTAVVISSTVWTAKEAEPDLSFSKAPMASIGIRHGSDGSLFGEYTSFARIDPKYKHYVAEFPNGSITRGEINDGFYFMMNRWAVKAGENPRLITENFAPVTVTFYTEDGTEKVIHPHEMDYGFGDSPSDADATSGLITVD